MGTLAFELVPFAIGLLVTPAPIAVAILLLASRRAVPNAVAFASAFVVVYGLLSGATLAVSGTRSGPLIDARTKAAVSIVVGGVLLLAAVALLVRGGAQPARRPRWMAQLEECGPGRALALGTVLAVANPNVAILLGGLATIVATDLSAPAQTLAALLLVVAAAAPPAAPVVAYVLAPERVAGFLSRVRAWLTRHQRTVDVAVFVVFGALFTARGVAGLG